MKIALALVSILSKPTGEKKAALVNCTDDKNFVPEKVVTLKNTAPIKFVKKLKVVSQNTVTL